MISRVLIVGGGIAGTTTAIALAQHVAKLAERF
jgi:flavin-dependent dehydrogenase